MLLLSPPWLVVVVNPVVALARAATARERRSSVTANSVNASVLVVSVNKADNVVSVVSASAPVVNVVSVNSKLF
jgi:hypothetical protein